MDRSSPLSEDPDAEAVLDALGDEAVRKAIESLSEPMAARELSDACDVPQSTLYRKLELLEDSTLVDEMVQITTGGQHRTQYARDFESITIEFENDRLVVDIDRPDESLTPDQRIEQLWSELKKETPRADN